MIISGISDGGEASSVYISDHSLFQSDPLMNMF